MKKEIWRKLKSHAQYAGRSDEVITVVFPRIDLGIAAEEQTHQMPRRELTNGIDE